MSLFVARFIYCNTTSKRQTSVIFGPDPKGPCGQSELLRLDTGRNWMNEWILKESQRLNHNQVESKKYLLPLWVECSGRVENWQILHIIELLIDSTLLHDYACAGPTYIMEFTWFWMGQLLESNCEWVSWHVLADSNRHKTKTPLPNPCSSHT